tara:strand:- start:11983 stop:12225 length:243 start_codon:yes stop_codon:yes gene_type:complete
MDKYADIHGDFIDSLKNCEKDLMCDLLDEGATWARAMKAVKETNEKLGQPVKIPWIMRGHEGFTYQWAEPKEEPKEELIN